MIHKSRPQKHVQTVKLYMYTSVRSRIVGFMFVLIMEYVRVVKGKGCKYVVNNYLFSQYCIRNSKRYVKWDVCSASGYIDGDKFVAVKPHSQHDDQSQEIQRLQFVVVSVLQKNPLNYCAEFLTDRHSLLKVQQLPQLHLTTLKVPCTKVEGSKCRNFR